MRIAVVGAGVLGLRLAHHLGRLGAEVDVLEAAPEIGGLAAPCDYGEFWWDRFYHCILPQDRHLIDWLKQLDLDAALRWRKAGTGYYSGGRFYSMNGAGDYLRFPLLSPLQKARLGYSLLRAMRMSDPYDLYAITAQQWLTRQCGRTCYEVFWRPLLRAKFGVLHDQVAAVFIWATITRLFGNQQVGPQAGHLGYVSGGYRRVLERVRTVLEAQGTRILTGVRVESIDEAGDSRGGRFCRLRVGERTTGSVERCYEQVFWTAPSALARAVAAPELAAYVSEMERAYPSSQSYLGVICLVLVLRRSLMPYYVLNIADSDVELTGLIEMTALVDKDAETNGRSLVYLPRYLPADAAEFNLSDDALRASFLDRGLARLFGPSASADIVAMSIHRARCVQALPLPTSSHPGHAPAPMRRPFTVLNTSMLQCATLNNNDVVGLVDGFVQRHGRELVRLADNRLVHASSPPSDIVRSVPQGRAGHLHDHSRHYEQ